jgi:hypothetical protein
MTRARGDLTIRPITGSDELELFCRIPYGLNAELAGDLRSGRRRPHWLWVAIRDDRLVGRVAWWARDPGGEPSVIDILDVLDTEDVKTGVQLLEAAMVGMPKVQYPRFVPPDWRDAHPLARGAGANRSHAFRGAAAPAEESGHADPRTHGPVALPRGGRP